MNRIIYLLALLVFSNTFGQVQKKFFVEDVKSIEYVTVNFCVNDQAKISEVTIVADKTTYENEYNIEQLRQYLLGVQYYPDSKLKNNCYDSTFEFINSSYEKKSLNKNVCDACKKFQNGHYKYKHVLYKDTKIKRKRKVQREIGIEDKQIYYIKWLSDCTYVLTYKRMTEPRLKHLIGKEINVEIIDILDDGSYVYRSIANFQEKTDYGIIKKMK
ncbi:hypothetical protein MQE36_05860 [Zhouia spongiae]|uniref:DUF3108 domain-containing protein n=1 Tax=Zhouia spongiae TaxID=2202721 RepID=A0ABY3YPW2_9FLAO|nr:hypothetical protein [Zhouia spongiae]UNY99871.1 hypothetical protein MQE36_05860 [Zhouia spongiae]